MRRRASVELPPIEYHQLDKLMVPLPGDHKGFQKAWVLTKKKKKQICALLQSQATKKAGRAGNCLLSPCLVSS